MPTKKVKETFSKIFEPPMHAHPAYFGSELACPYCNPYCWEKHGMGKTTFCGDPDCPMNPKNFKKVVKCKKGK